MTSGEHNSLGFLLHDASRLLRRRFEMKGAAYGLTSSQWRALVYLVREGASAQARLAEFLEVEPISVSRLVDRMAQAGWVERLPDPADRRVRLVHATDQAVAAFAEVKALAGEVYEEALAGLEEPARAALVDGLTRIVANLSDCGDAGPCGAARKGEGEQDERAE